MRERSFPDNDLLVAREFYSHVESLLSKDEGPLRSATMRHANTRRERKRKREYARARSLSSRDFLSPTGGFPATRHDRTPRLPHARTHTRANTYIRIHMRVHAQSHTVAHAEIDTTRGTIFARCTDGRRDTSTGECQGDETRDSPVDRSSSLRRDGRSHGCTERISVRGPRIQGRRRDDEEIPQGVTEKLLQR